MVTGSKSDEADGTPGNHPAGGSAAPSTGRPRPDRDFPLFWAGQAASAVGDRLTGFAAPTLAILVLDATDAEAGAVAAAGWLAYPVVGLVAGAVLARARVRRVVVCAELVRLCVFVVAAAAVAAGWVTSVFPLVVAIAVAGTATVFTDLANQVQLPALVPPARLVGANSRLQSTDSASKLVGPALGGVLVTVLGSVAALALGALPFLLSALTRARVDTPRPDLPPHPEPVTARIRDGLRYTARHPLHRPLVLSGAVRGLGIGAVDAALLLFAYRVLGMSSTSAGLLVAAGAAGALVGVACVGPLTRLLGVRGALRATVLEGLAWCAVPLCLLLPAPVPVLFAVRVLSALWIPVTNVLVTSVRQRHTPPERQGGVHATARVLTSSAIPLGALAGGLAAEVLGARLGQPAGLVSVITAGGLCAAGAVLLLPSEVRFRDTARP